MKRLFPLLLVIPWAAWAVSRAMPPKPPRGGMDTAAFGRILINHDGRVQPLDSMARNALRTISGRQTLEDAQGERRAAIVWLLDTLVKPESDDYRVFRIENFGVLSALGLEAREGYRYAYNEFAERLPAVEEQAFEAQKLKNAGDSLDLTQTKMMELVAQVHRYIQARRPEPWFIVPPARPNAEWSRMAEAGAEDPTVQSFIRILMAYHDGKVDEFNIAVTEHLARQEAVRPEEAERAAFEAWFNHAEPFYVCSVLYVFAFVFVAVSWLGRFKPANDAAFWLIVFTFLAHTAALGARLYISGRPPVTNLYSSAVFIGWAVVGFGLIFEPILKHGFGNVVGAAAGFATLLIAHNLAADGDTFAVLQAVLDTQFWLATHVVCITLGYATTYLAGLLATVVILHFGLTPELRKRLATAVYGTVCFATFFSFVGTVLGGLWADDSWGRFWGWDPKENGALIIVLWNVLVLHARWGNLVRERGLAMLAVFGNIVVSWSWFGVNELGVGLHSYGFTEGVRGWLLVYCASQLLVMGVAWMRRPAFEAAAR